ncbi:hypothetical protein RsTz2092_05560 [Deferribacterales bacterium RsTz2092]|nr:hypothetical protein AGMMS49941_09410 [Deferribacterales bacterium]
MYTILISVTVSALVGAITFALSGSVLLATVLAIVVLLLITVLIGRYFYKRMQSLMEQVEKDIKADKIERAVERMKGAYAYSNWQFMVKKQIDSQIGTIYYARKRFDEAFPLLKSAVVKNWPSMCMLASQYFRIKDYDKALSTMDKTMKGNKKEAFVYSLYAYMLMERGKTDKAIEVLHKGIEKLPTDERLVGELEAVRNNKKIKIQNYGAMWMQMHIGAKMPDGARQYQAFLSNQKIKRR